MDIEIENVKPRAKGAMTGFFDMRVGGVRFLGCMGFKKGEKVWFSLPQRKSTDRNGQISYEPFVEVSPDLMQRMQTAYRQGVQNTGTVDTHHAEADHHEQTATPATPRGAGGGQRETGDRAYQESRRVSKDPAGSDLPW